MDVLKRHVRRRRSRKLTTSVKSRAVMSPVCYVRGSTADWSGWWRRGGRGGEGESPGRQQSAHCPVTSSTSPPPDIFTTHSLMMNPLQFFNTYPSLFPCTVFSIYRTHHCMRCLTHGSKLPQATTDSSHPAAETPQHKPNQSLKWTVSSLLFGFMLKISCLTMQILKVLEQCSDELKWTFLMEAM